MGTKTISLADDAYRRLRRLKRDDESFSDVVQRLTGRGDLMRFHGAISAELADELQAGSTEFRERLERGRRR